MKLLQTDVTLDDGSKYQIKRIKAVEGTYISNLLLTKMVPGMMAPLLGLSGAGVDAPSMSPDEWNFIQRKMLALVSKYEEKSGLPLPIMNAGGQIANSDLEYDPALMTQLVARAIGFNFADFFGKEAMSLARILGYITGQTSPTSLLSTTTSGVQSSPDSGGTPKS